MKQKTCCFTGHRAIAPTDIPLVRERLEETVRMLVGEGVIYFGAGGAIGFDTLAAQTVLALKKEFPYIRLILVLPCKNQAEAWGRRDRDVYEEIKRQADKIVYVSEQYTAECMRERNRRLVDNSSVCVCYLKQYGGGTGYTAVYAQKQGLCVINLA